MGRKFFSSLIASKTDLVKYLNVCIDRKKLTAIDGADLALYYDKIIAWSSKLLQTY